MAAHLVFQRVRNPVHVSEAFKALIKEMAVGVGHDQLLDLLAKVIDHFLCHALRVHFKVDSVLVHLGLSDVQNFLRHQLLIWNLHAKVSQAAD